MRHLDRGVLAQIATFAVIGLGSTLAYAAIYLALRTATGPQTANALALVVTAVGNTLVNRRLTFGVRGRAGMAGDLAAGMVALALLITTASVTVLGAILPAAPRWLEVAVLTGANIMATGSRFVLLRAWIGGRGRTPLHGDLATERVPR